MLILRNMCCYLSVSRLSVLVCVMCASSGYEIYQFLFVSPSLFSLPHSCFDLFLSLSMIRCWLAWRFIFHCIHSFSRSSFLDRHFCSFVCALLICTWLHNNAQFYSAEIEYFGLNVPDDWRAADGPFIELSIRMKKKERRTQDSIFYVCVDALEQFTCMQPSTLTLTERRTMTCISSSYIATSHPLNHVHILIWPRIDFYYIVMLCMKITFIFTVIAWKVCIWKMWPGFEWCFVRFKENRSTDDLLHLVYSQ